MPNANTLYANTFVDALISAGLKRVCVAPGSRHTPLVLAFARHREAISIYSHLDERSAAFFALGLALSSNEPAAVVCTSGSAAANFFPAVVEARQSRLPLLVLTADRPQELRWSGANQTIDQVKIYGDYAAWFYDAPLPEADPPAVALRNLRSLAARALAMTAAGAVHINLPFRKPFEPEGDDSRAMTIDRRSPARIQRPRPADAGALRDLLTADVLRRRGLIYFGHGSCRDEDEARALMRFAAQLSRAGDYPVLAEFTSNLRSAEGAYQPLSAYESAITAGAIDLESIEALIRFGAPPLSKTVQDAFERADPERHIYCSRAGDWADDGHRISDLVVFDPMAAETFEFEGDPSAAENRGFRERMARIDNDAWTIIEREIDDGEYFDGAAVYDTVDLLPADGIVFAGNSLPVRHLDQFGRPGDKRMLAFANRGASGIDGNISTALGVGAARAERPLAVIVGDITFYHDMNGLLAVHRCGLPVTIVLLNNGGGGIFHRLPIRSFEPEFSDFFITAHGLDFAHAAKLYGLDYVLADDRAGFRAAVGESLQSRRSTIIELRTDARQDLRRRREIMRAVRERLKQQNL